MSTALLSIKTDEQTKKELQAFAKELGLTSTALVNALIKQSLRTKHVELSTSLEPTPYLQKLIKEAEADYAAGRNITTVNTREELEDYLNSL
jgi:addiction module RelB/DinJ family antitoxin